MNTRLSNKNKRLCFNIQNEGIIRIDHNDALIIYVIHMIHLYYYLLS
jgi:hypothetical protein